MTGVAAIDLGAESGRVTHARFDGRRIEIDVVNRFANRTIDVAGRPRWDIEALWSDIRSGLLELGTRAEVASVGVDSWGVDYGLLRAGDGALAPGSRLPQVERAAAGGRRPRAGMHAADDPLRRTGRPGTGDRSPRPELSALGDRLSRAEITALGDRLTPAEMSALSDRLTRAEMSALGERLARGEMSALGERLTPAEMSVLGERLGRGEVLVEAPPTYRDPLRHTAFEAAMREWGPDLFYRATGAQVHEINGVYSLIHDVRVRPELLDRAERLLMIPDLFHHRLSGSLVTEYTAATTSGLFDIARGTWATALAERVGIPAHLFPEVVPAGTDVGPLLLDSPTAGLGRTRVTAPAAHDTASAIVAIPDLDSSTMFISSGTWSLAGVLLDRPVISAAAQRANLTNEGSYAGGVRVLRDIAGLWLLQECRRQWIAEGTEIGYAELAELAGREQPLRACVDVDSGEFLASGDMPARIRAACARNGMPVPETIGQVTRVVVDSLALAYRRTVRDIEAVTGTTIKAVAVVGGGVANRVLQQATASATGRPVTCWAAEGTALGNAAVQLASLGELAGPGEISRVVEASSPPTRYEPIDTAAWEEAAHRHDSR
ncbi:rhamnulokinase [Actinoplanes couchii]|uniref:Rhamnulokinase n=1 Tax=Actinoplanes couchii TaxID=403638 RepID=A0ABQ3XDI7_9ACTN|nr:FGGY-family carbohydrate kinase [Actinoplanes couchii]MDR6317081.1 rhamnulokinase [Actinoplanes couchii]GID56576.1 hypothetical protein Aco03nite_049800 [Actinoplanes couchii]